MKTIRERMIARGKLEGKSPKTMDLYVGAVERYLKHVGGRPERAEYDQILGYVLYRVDVDEATTSTLRLDIAGLKFLYAHLLGQPEKVARLPWPKQPKSFPEVLSREEVSRLFAEVDSVIHKAILTTAYGAGLRIGEVLKLEVRDIDSSRMIMRVRQGKGQKDRDLPLPQSVLENLRVYWRQCRVKDKRSELLFVGRDGESPVTAKSVGDSLHMAAVRAGLRKHCTSHTLRHSFATHHHESGTDIWTLQMLLGHTSIRTTTRYLHMSRAALAKTKSPIESIRTARIIG
jgi:site-specific recombinase XerD